MIKGKTTSGFEFTIDEAALDDMRLIDTMTAILTPGASKSDILAANSKGAEILLGRELKNALYEHIGRQHGGRVPVAVFAQELKEIMAAPGKDAEKN